MCKSEFIGKKDFGNKSVIRLVVLTFIASFTLLTSAAYAQGNLLITPRRVVFDGTRRVMELNLANTGQDTSKYNVSILQYRMNEDGSFTEITTPDPGQNFADKNIRFFPRTVTLGPNETQAVKMQVTNMEQLAPGEYRSHVYFRAVPKQAALGENDLKKDTTAVSVQLVPIFGITIPVIIRVGESTTKVNFSDLRLDMVNDTTNVLLMTFNRTGNFSVYGDVKVVYTSPTGKTTVIGEVNGIAVYTPNLTRKFRMDLDNKAKVKGNVNYHTGSLKITFSAQSDTHPEKYAEAELKLQ